MASSYFGGEKRLAGKAYRTGEMGKILDDLYADIDSSFVLAEAGILAAGVLSADASGRAKMADDYFTSAEVSAAGAGGKFAAASITTAGLSHLVAANAFDDATVQALFATGSISVTGAADIIAANAIAASKLEAGAAAAGVDGGDVKFSTTQAAGALAVAKIPVLLELAIFDAASANNDFTGLVGKHKIIDVWVTTAAAGDAGNTYTIKTGADAAITNAVTPGAPSGSTAHAALIDPANSTILNAGTIRVAHVRNGGSSLAVVNVLLVPVV